MTMRDTDGFWVITAVTSRHDMDQPCSVQWFPARQRLRAFDCAQLTARLLGLSYSYEDRLYLIEW